VNLNIDLSEHKAVNKIIIPHKISINQNGVNAAGVEILKLEFIDKIDAAEFEPPLISDSLKVK